jgi:protein-disulfide isomerase
VLAVLGAVLLVVAAIVISQSGSDDDDGTSGAAAGGQSAAAVDAVEGLPQSGDTLGEPDAPFTIVEFGDLQCPFCGQFGRNEVPKLIEGPVAAGDANLQFRNWAILGPDSETAAAAALAAGEQNRMWSFVEAFYADQGEENSGYVTDEFLRQIAETAGVPDLERWESDRDPSRWTAELSDVDAQATELGFTGTPSFAIVGPQGTTPLPNASTADQIEQALAAAG